MEQKQIRNVVDVDGCNLFYFNIGAVICSALLVLHSVIIRNSHGSSALRCAENIQHNLMLMVNLT